jgi:hypothetical protein
MPGHKRCPMEAITGTKIRIKCPGLRKAGFAA